MKRFQNLFSFCISIIPQNQDFFKSCSIRVTRVKLAESIVTAFLLINNNKYKKGDKYGGR